MCVITSDFSTSKRRKQHSRQHQEYPNSSQVSVSARQVPAKHFQNRSEQARTRSTVSTFWAPLSEGRKWEGTQHLTRCPQEPEKLCPKDLTHFLAEAIHFVYTLLLIKEHFWVTAAKVDSLTHLLLRQIATIWTFTILIPWETAWMKHTILTSMEITLCVCVPACVRVCERILQNLREETDISITNTV